MENRIIILDGHALNPGDLSWELITKLGQVTVYDNTPQDLVLERAKDADILILNKIRITKELISLLPKLKFIGLMATGFDNVDVQACKENKISVSNIIGYSTPSVAQSVFSLLLHITNRSADYSQEVHNGIWNQKARWTYWYEPIMELKNKTLGIIGYGKIGQAVAKIALAFEMKVQVYTRTIGKDTLVDFVDLETLLSNCDVLSLHVPLQTDTKHIINANSLSKMKPSSILINASRGGLIDEVALKDALLTRSIYAAGLDVLSQEPPSLGHPLINCEHCYITPHQAWGSLESRSRLMQQLSENIKGFIEGNPINLLA